MVFRIDHVLFAVLLLSFTAPCLVKAQKLDTSMGPEPRVQAPVRHDVSAPLRDIIPASPRNANGEPKEVPLFLLEDRYSSSSVVDQRGYRSHSQDASVSLQSSPRATSFSYVSSSDPLVSFEGIDYTGLVPPDPNGDVGPDHYVQTVNSSFAVWDKSGTLLYGPVANTTIFTNFGGECETEFDFDPIILYDHLADRWVITYVVDGPPYFQCIAVSQTSDPTGSWHRYAYDWITDKFNDYPKLGVWPDGYYLSVNHFDAGTDAGVAVFERSKMLSGNVATEVIIDLDNVSGTQFGLLPSDLDGAAPTSAVPNYFARIDISSDQLEIWEFNVDWSNPGSSSFTQVDVLSTLSFDEDMCSAFRERCIPQPNTSTLLEAISDRLMHRLQYRDFGSHQVLMANHTVDANGSGRAGIRWYELRKADNNWAIYQQGTYTPDTNHRWMGSVAMNGDGSIALGYTVSSASMFPSIRITGRAEGAPLGMLNAAEQTLINGGGSQTGSSRWGDYSMMAVDPSDNKTFWFTHEYLSETSSASWNTHIGSFNATPPTVSIDNLTITDATYYEARNSITSSSTTIGNGADVTLRITDSGSIVLEPGFEAQLGSELHAYVGTGSDGLMAATRMPLEATSGKGPSPAPSTVPSAFRLLRNYPNPFNPSTEITFVLADAMHVDLTVYDATGKEIVELVNSRLEAGLHQVQFDAADLSSGIYFYRLASHMSIQSRAMILLK